MRIGHDGRGLGTGWYLEEVVVIIHDECWIFPCNRWLADYEDDGKTERDLYAGQSQTKMEKKSNNKGIQENVRVIVSKRPCDFTVCCHLCDFRVKTIFVFPRGSRPHSDPRSNDVRNWTREISY